MDGNWCQVSQRRKEEGEKEPRSSRSREEERWMRKGVYKVQHDRSHTGVTLPLLTIGHCAVESRKNTISFGQFQLKRAKKLGFEQSSKIKDV